MARLAARGVLAAAARRTAWLGPRLIAPLVLAAIAFVLSSRGYRFGGILAPAGLGLAVGCWAVPRMRPHVTLLGIASVAVVVVIVVMFCWVAVAHQGTPARWLSAAFGVCWCMWLTEDPPDGGTQ